MNAPLITIGITCFNAGDVIIRAIQSGATQDYKNIEIVVVDDFSTDDSIDKIESFLSSEPRGRLIRHPHNKGYPAALNTIVQAAKGEYIAFFDDDDTSAPSRLSEQLKRIEDFGQQHGTDKIFCYTNRAVVLPGQKAADHTAYAIGRQPPEPGGYAVADNILWHSNDRKSVWGLFGSGTMMVKKSYLENLGSFDETFRRSAEWDMAIRASLDGAYFISVDMPLVTQYKTPTADKSGAIPLKYALQLRDKHKSYLDGKGVFLASRYIARHRYAHNKGQGLQSMFWLGAACLANPKQVGIEKALHHFQKFYAKMSNRK